jgi:hypothetical protein
MNTKKNILLAVTTGIFLVGSSVVNSATVNVNLGVSTAGGFTLRNSAGADLTSGSLVKLGVFVNTTSGAQLSNDSVRGLYSALSTFNQNTTSILANFIQIGEGKINFGLANGLAGGQLGSEAGATANYLTDPFTFNSELGSGAFNRSWLDNTLSIQDANAGLGLFNSLANTKLVGLQVAAIVFNGSTVDDSSEFLVARNNVVTEVLPSESGASVTFSLASGSSDLLIGTAVGSTAFQTIPEPSTMTLSLIGSIALFRRRKQTSRLS